MKRIRSDGVGGGIGDELGEATCVAEDVEIGARLLGVMADRRANDAEDERTSRTS